MTDTRVRVIFDKVVTGWNPQDSGAFEPAEAKKYVDAGVAHYEEPIKPTAKKKPVKKRKVR